MLERLMSNGVYSRDQDTGDFDPNYVTKLVRSFRSHPEILEIPNDCFYDNELLAWADTARREMFCRWEVGHHKKLEIWCFSGPHKDYNSGLKMAKFQSGTGGNAFNGVSALKI